MKIKEIRNRLGLTQSELADVLGLSSQNYISKYESGEKSPGIQTRLLLYLLDKKIIKPKTLEDAKRRLTT